MACELRQAYCATQKRSGLDSSACSRKRLPIAVPLVFSQFFFFLLDYELIRLLKAITTVFEYLGLGKPNKSGRTEPQKDSFFMSTVVLR